MMAERRSLSFGQFKTGADAERSAKRLRETESRMRRSREWGERQRAEQERKQAERAAAEAAEREAARRELEEARAAKAELARVRAEQERVASRRDAGQGTPQQGAKAKPDYSRIPTSSGEERVSMSRSEFVSAMQEAMSGALREKEARDEARKNPANWTAEERYEYRKQAYRYALDRICEARQSGRYDSPYYEPLVFAAGEDLADDDLPVTFNQNAPAYQRWLGTPAYHRFCWRHDLADGITSPDDGARDAYRAARDMSPIGRPASMGPNPDDYGCSYR